MSLTNPYPHSLADLIVTLYKLSPRDEETINKILNTLGICFDPKVERINDILPSKTVPESPIENRRQENKKEHILPPSPTEIFNSSDEPSIPSTLSLIEKSQTDFPAWFYNPLSLRNNVSSSGPFTSYPLQTLFTPNWTRDILVNSLSIHENFGPIDIDEIVRLISMNEPLREIPRLPYPTIVHGVQVLLDDSKTLEPFYKDQINLIKAVRKVAGLDRTQILRFVGCPLRGIKYGAFDNLSDYNPPSSRSTVLLVTDFGILNNPSIYDRSGVSEWYRFASIVRKADCFLVAFVPYPKERWPKPLQDIMRIIQWDRKTSVSSINRLLRKSLKL